jgi:glycine betaine/choline ABC-type transport system substrate-binding protein
MRRSRSRRRLTLAVSIALLTACAGHQPDRPAPATQPSMAVGASSDPESVLLANLYAAALRTYGTPAHVEATQHPLSGLDTGQLSVVPGFTGRLLQTFQPGATVRSDEQTYRAMVGSLPEGVAVGDYTTAAEDKPAVAVTAATATAWGRRDLTAAVGHCAQLSTGAVQGTRPPVAIGRCMVPQSREYPDQAALFEALLTGEVKAAWTTTADPGVPDDVVLLADGNPALIQAQNVVPLYRRNELTPQQVLAINQVAGVLDTGALKTMRQQVAEGADPRAVAEGWLAENPPGR